MLVPVAQDVQSGCLLPNVGIALFDEGQNDHRVLFLRDQA